jgi:hypothetical protein
VALRNACSRAPWRLGQTKKRPVKFIVIDAS